MLRSVSFQRFPFSPLERLCDCESNLQVVKTQARSVHRLPISPNCILTGLIYRLRGTNWDLYVCKCARVCTLNTFPWGEASKKGKNFPTRRRNVWRALLGGGRKSLRPRRDGRLTDRGVDAERQNHGRVTRRRADVRTANVRAALKHREAEMPSNPLRRQLRDGGATHLHARLRWG